MPPKHYLFKVPTFCFVFVFFVCLLLFSRLEIFEAALLPQKEIEVPPLSF